MQLCRRHPGLDHLAAKAKRYTLPADFYAFDVVYKTKTVLKHDHKQFHSLHSVQHHQVTAVSYACCLALGRSTSYQFFDFIKTGDHDHPIGSSPRFYMRESSAKETSVLSGTSKFVSSAYVNRTFTQESW